ncbi:MAG: MFS transporter, partial [Alphaproteobacteria bacterium]|nr:MFS transporter [Alphaproteobacteria bacterium]
IRPLGAVIFGYVGDLIGRKRVLTITIAVMAVPTTLMGCLPTYAEIGIAAPILLALLRIVQGLSVSGELIGSIVYLIEDGPKDRRGFFGSISYIGAFLGILMGSLFGALISGLFDPAAVEDWAWRIPFLAGSILGIVGYLVRRKLPELPQRGDRADSPVVETVRDHLKPLAQGFAVVMLVGAGFVMMFVYIITWLRQMTHEPRAEILTINSLSMAVLVLAVMVSGMPSDKIGRKPLVLFSAGGTALLAYPLLWLMHHDSAVLILCGQFGFAILVGTICGVMPVILTELFPWRIRVSAAGIAYNVPFTLFGGTAPMIGAWLVARSGDAMAIAWYLSALALITFLVSLTLRETKDMPLPT